VLIVALAEPVERPCPTSAKAPPLSSYRHDVGPQLCEWEMPAADGRPARVPRLELSAAGLGNETADGVRAAGNCADGSAASAAKAPLTRSYSGVLNPRDGMRASEEWWTEVWRA